MLLTKNILIKIKSNQSFIHAKNESNQIRFREVQS